jgi:hypothetical protein
MQRMQRLLIPTIVAAGALLGLTGCGGESVVAPSPQLGPDQVVRLQLEALQRADDPQPDAGIVRAWAFASPGNKQAIGPVDRFITVVRSPGYAPLLNCREFQLGQVLIDGDRAQQIVAVKTADDALVFYVFQLSRQSCENYNGCWMTDAVMPVSPRGESGSHIETPPLAPRTVPSEI